MPFSRGTVPPRLRGKGIPQNFVDMFIGVFNSVLKGGGDEASAYKQAYGVMHKAMVKAGYHKDEDGAWSRGEEMNTDRQILVGVPDRVKILEQSDKGLRYQGVALIDEAISQSGFGRYYSRAFNDRCMAATNTFMEQGGKVTVYSRHGKVIAPPGQLPTGLPVGKVVKPLWRDGHEVWYEAMIVPTTEGKDVIELIRQEVMMASSIRASSYKSRMRQMGDVEVEEMLEAVIVGIDLCDEPGIEGAGIRKILEEAPALSDIKEEEEKTMEWKDITLEGLQTNRKDLHDAIAAAALDAQKVAITDLQAKLADAQKVAGTLTEEKGAEVGKAVKLTEQVGALTLQVKIEQAAQVGVSKQIAEALRKDVKTEADIAKMLPDAREKALTALLAESANGTARGKGQSNFEGDADAEDDEGPELTEAQEAILAIAG